MKTKHRFLLITTLLVVAAIIGLIWAAPSGRKDLVYGGQPLSEWVRQGRIAGVPLDSNAAPYLVSALQRREQPWEGWEMRNWTNLPAWLQRRLSSPVPASTIHENAMQLLADTGPASPETIRVIVNVASHPPYTTTPKDLRPAAFDTLASIGVNSPDAERGVIELLKGQLNGGVIRSGLDAICKIDTNRPSILLKLIDSHNAGEMPLRWDAMFFLSHADNGDGYGLRALAAIALDDQTVLSARIQACQIMDEAHGTNSILTLRADWQSDELLQAIRDRADQELNSLNEKGKDKP